MASNIEEIFHTSPEVMRKSPSKSADSPKRHASNGSSPSSGSMEKDDDPLFKPGDVLECVTKNDRDAKVIGQVLCYDRALGILVLREEQNKMTLMRFLNMSHILNIIKREPAPEDYASELPDSSEAAEQRLKKSEAEKRAIFIDEVSRDAIETFVCLKKILDDVVWQEKDIKILKRVLVKEPYDLDSVEALDSSSKTLQAVEQVKKILSQKSSRRANSDPPPDLLQLRRRRQGYCEVRLDPEETVRLGDDENAPLTPLPLIQFEIVEDENANASTPMIKKSFTFLPLSRNFT